MMSVTNRERAPLMSRPGKKPEAPFNILSLVPMTYRVMAVSCIFLAALNLAAFVLHSLALSLFVRWLQLFRPFVDWMALYVPAISQILSHSTSAENNGRIVTAATLLACDWVIVAPALLLMLATSVVQFCLSGPSINWLIRKRLNERNITMFENSYWVYWYSRLFPYTAISDMEKYLELSAAIYFYSSYFPGYSAIFYCGF